MKSTTKSPLKCSPFVRSFEYGINSEGFWNYSHMVVQFEDVVDVLQALFANQYHFIFFFDHNTGHDKTRLNGLSSSKMNKMFGGGQNEMRKSEIKITLTLDHFNILKSLRWATSSQCNMNWAILALSIWQKKKEKNLCMIVSLMKCKIKNSLELNSLIT